MDRTLRRAALVVDDDPTVARQIAQSLYAQGFDPFAAYDARDALAFVANREHRPQKLDLHLLVADLYLPGIFGSALVAELRRRWPALKVLYVTGGEAPAHLVGDDVVLRKPFTMTQLEEAIATAVSRATPESALARTDGPADR